MADNPPAVSEYIGGPIEKQATEDAADDPGRAVTTFDDCEHHWRSDHQSGHLIYWVRQCAFCFQVDWDDLDKQIREAWNELDAAKGCPGCGEPTGCQSPG